MIGLRILAALGGLAAHSGAAELPGASLAADSAMLAEALSGRTLQLAMRGATVAVMATAAPAEGGCATLVSARAPGRGRKWSRLFRWSEVAWTGATPEGATLVSFFDDEGRLPVDKVVFSPADGAEFRTALARLAGNCQTARREDERVRIAGRGPARGCYFARMPGLRLVEALAPGRPRAVLTVLSRETPEAELRLIFERNAPDATDGDESARPTVVFSFADPLLGDMRIAAANFALDARPVAAEHALTAYGDTRVRIGMDPFAALEGGVRQGSFYPRLSASKEARLTLLDSAGRTQVVLNFDSGATLAMARKALAAADWSCSGAVPAPAPAARWQPAS